MILKLNEDVSIVCKDSVRVTQALQLKYIRHHYDNGIPYCNVIASQNEVELANFIIHTIKSDDELNSMFAHNITLFSFVYAKSTADGLTYSNRLSSLLKRFKHVYQIGPQLQLCSFAAITNAYIDVEFYGNRVDGSYVHDYEIAPAYVRQLSITTDCKVEWIGRSSFSSKLMTAAGMFQDIYKFRVYHTSRYGKYNWIFSGTPIIVYDEIHTPPISYVQINAIYQELKIGNAVLNNIGVSLKDSVIYADGIKIAKIIESIECKPKHHGIFDLYVSRQSLQCIFISKLQEYIKHISTLNFSHISVNADHESIFITTENVQFFLTKYNSNCFNAKSLITDLTDVKNTLRKFEINSKVIQCKNAEVSIRHSYLFSELWRNLISNTMPTADKQIILSKKNLLRDLIILRIDGEPVLSKGDENTVWCQALDYYSNTYPSRISVNFELLQSIE